MHAPLSAELAGKRDRLVEMIRGYGSCAVAFSGGIDSTVVAKAAALALGDAAVAVTGTSASLASGELDTARSLARLIGIRHEVIATGEFANDQYVRNAPDRCYHCKTELYTQLAGLCERLGVAMVANGANLDDLGDYRPGMVAAREHRVVSPLAECQFDKAAVRALAACLAITHLGQTGVSLLEQPSGLRSGSDAGSPGDDRRCRTVAARPGFEGGASEVSRGRRGAAGSAA